jgi:cytochrome P450
MPTPRAALPGPLEAVRLLRQDVLSLFTARAYQNQVLPFRLLGRQILVVNNPETVREVFVLKHATYERKSRFMEAALEPVIGDSLFINHGTPWSERRAALAPELHPSAIAGFHPLFVQVATELAETWEASIGGPPRDIAADLAAATARVVMLATFGTGAPREAGGAIAREFAAYQEAVESLDFLHLLGLPDWMPSFQRRTALTAAARIRALVETLTAAAPRDAGLLGVLAGATRADGSTLLEAKALTNEIAMMLLAGSETSANALGWTLYLASAHPPTLAALRAEGDAVLGARAAPDASELAALPFTRAAIAEAMRLYPPVAILSRQALAADTIRRWDIAPGMTVACIPWLLHRHEQLWDAPHAFRPQRFLPEAKKPQPFAYIPFGLGPRVCAGAAFGSAEMAVFVSVLLRRFDLRIAPGHQVMPKLRLTLRPAGGLPMLIARRA